MPSSSNAFSYQSLMRRQKARGWLFALTALALLAALFAGGASRQNDVQSAVVEVIMLALAPFAVWMAIRSDLYERAKWPLLVLAATLLLAAAQLIPLPSSLWTKLPGRELAVQVYATTGVRLPWLPVSMAWLFTMKSALALTAPIVMFLAVSSLSNAQRYVLGGLIIGAAVVGMVLGGIQMAGGYNSPAYLYSNVSSGFPVGFFSNRNHQANLMVCLLPLAAALVTRFHDSPARKLVSILCGALFLLVIVALVVLQSRSATVLAFPAMIASALLLRRGHVFGKSPMAVVVIAGIAGSALLLVLLYGLSTLLARFQGEVVASDMRFEVIPVIWRSALSYAPFGSGIGSFDLIYRTVEPHSEVHQQFLNHAHDDYLEVFLETGVAGILIAILFIAWWIRRTIGVWTEKGSGTSANLARAATVIVGVLLAHSATDYPLRTLAMASVFGFACALLVPSPRSNT